MQIFQAFEDGTGHPVHFDYRVVTASQAQTDFVTTPTTTLVTDFGITAGPLTSSNFAAAGGVIQVPFSYQTVSVYFNLPNTTSISLTPCILAKILLGVITSWNTPAILTLDAAGSSTPITGTGSLNDANDAVISGATVFLEASSATSTAALYAYLAAGNSGCSSSWTSSTTPAIAPTYGTAAQVAANIAKTPYSIGVLMSYAGKAAGLTEVSIQTNSASEYVTSKNFNASE